MRIQTLPRRFILRVMVCRQASIWRVVIHARSSACKPYSPKDTLDPFHAVPARLVQRGWQREDHVLQQLRARPLSQRDASLRRVPRRHRAVEPDVRAPAGLQRV